MGALIVIGIIVLIIWIYSSNNKSSYNRPSQSPPVNQNERLVLERSRKNAQKLKLEAEKKQQAKQLALQKVKQEEIKKLEAAKLLAVPKEKINKRTKFYRTDWNNFHSILIQHSVNKLYHFTDRSNLQSIIQHGGLFSWYYCKQNNITIPKPGGSPTSWILDARKGLQNFVRVSFVRDHPMMFIAKNDGRITDPVILEIDMDVIYLKGTRYAAQNAAKNGVIPDNTLEKFNTIRFPLLRQRYFDLSADDKPYYQAEVLVLEKIPLEYISNIKQYVR